MPQVAGERLICESSSVWRARGDCGLTSTYLSNDDVGPEVVALSGRVVDPNIRSNNAGDAVLDQLSLPI